MFDFDGMAVLSVMVSVCSGNQFGGAAPLLLRNSKHALGKFVYY